MEFNSYLAGRLEEVLLNGKWIANTNFNDQITTTTWQQAITKINTLNSIAALTFHINYYLKGLINVFAGGQLLIKDKYSFDMPDITTAADWDTLTLEFYSNAEKFIHCVAHMNNSLFYQPFIKHEYGTYLRNIEAVIEHSYYHLGQITLIKKLLNKN